MDVLGLDLAPTLNGYCVGSGLSVPEADAWVLPDCGRKLGRLARAHRANLRSIFTIYQISHVGYEAPLLRRHDKLWTLRRTYGLGMVTEDFVEEWNEEHGAAITCGEVDVREVKRKLTGDPFADKSDLVKTALRLGIKLPPTDVLGRKDAADAFAVWLCVMADHGPRAFSEWDARIARTKGALL